MATQIQFRRGTKTQHNSFTGATAEVTVNTTNKSLHVHDGTTQGGFEQAKVDLTNVSGATNLSLSGITTTNSLSIGSTQVISSARQLQNIVSLDATTTATIESAVAAAPNDFTSLNISGLSTFSGITTHTTSLFGRDASFSGVITATSFVGAITGAVTGTATSTTNIPNLTGAITSNNTTTSLGSFSSANLSAALTDETGTGVAVFATSPTLVTPVLGAASATSINSSGIITASTFSGNLANTLTLATSGTGLSGSTTFNNSGASSFTVTSNATNNNTNSTIVARDASGNFSAGTITASLTGTATSTTNIPNLTGAITSVNTATSLGSFTSSQLATALTDETGSGANVFATSPVLVTPSLGIATATSINVSGIITATQFVGALTGTATSTTNIPNLTGDISSVNTATTLATVNSNVGTFGGTGAIPVVTVNGKGLVTGVTTVAPNNGTLTLATSGTGLSGSASFTANQSGASSFTVTSNATNANTASAIVARDGSGNFSAGTITASLTGTASTTTNIPNLTGAITSVNTTTSLGSFTSLQLLTALSDETGSGSAVFATSPTLVTPVLGAASATSIVVGSGVTINASGINASGIVTASQLSTGASGTGINITTNTISGPATLTIDPAAVGDNTGLVVIKGDLQIDGTTTTINSTTVTVDDKNIVLGSGAVNDAAADGSGITIESGNGNKTFQFEDTGDNLGSSENLNVASGKVYKINNTSVLSSTTLGSGVVNSSLTSVGTLTNLSVVNVNSTGIITATTFVGALTGTATSTTNIPNLTGDITSVNKATTLATVNSNVGTFGSGGSIPTITVNAKGLVTGVTTTAVNPANDGTLTLAVSGTGLSGSASFTANQSGASTFTVTSNATNANTVSTIVARDGSGNFSAGTITASLTGTASSTTNIPNLTGDITSVNSVTSIAAGVIVNADINASAGIVDTKLATISTAGKVSNSATTATNANTASAIVARDASGNFSAGTITASLTGTASSTTNIPNLTGDITSVNSVTSIAAGVIVNADINASAAIAVSKLAASTISGVTLGNNLNALTISTGLSGSSYNGSGAVTIAIDSTVATLTGTQTLTNKTLTSPTLTTPVLGTPSSGTLTSCTGLPLSTGVTGTLPVANGGTGVTSSTGTGSVVLSASPTLTTPALGTPASGTLTSCTGLPITGITSSTTIGLGVGSIELGHATDTTITRVSAGLVAIEGVNVVTVSATQTLTNKTLTSPTLTTPVLGTPSSGTLTSCTGLPIVAGTTGTLSVARGGTGVTASTGTGSVVLSASPTFTGTVGAAAITATGDIAAANFNSTSDISLKGNIQTIVNPLDKITKLNGVTFNWKENQKPSIGVIAQELEKVLPELVTQGDVKSVNYNGLIGVLIEAVKEQQKQIEELKAIIKNQ